MFTDEQKKVYLENFGNMCPYCHYRSPTTIGDIEEDDDGAQKQWLTCDDCGKCWEDIYELVDIREENDRRDQRCRG